ncbi:PREDICTED: zinc finger MYM-type protein 1-like [Trachymyrmex cornetzi]|uniref:zinc finger MYM-type protein 1-like n=1 Tax=Trachymyrmex cornetzi TaxID=471704 RepID=UPI00084F61C2|nr:PREDICTED: zinc finger MYM-type protein 1-like [Trachymyrmex cornetzi]
MSGVYNGLQKRIKNVQPLALYVHCAAHNLNLVINDSVKNITEINHFYDKLESLYAFFANSIKRWAYLKSESSINISLKRLCSTRWSSRNDLLLALRLLYSDLMKVLAYIALMGRNSSEKNEIAGLQKYFEKFDVIVILTVEAIILDSLKTQYLYCYNHPNVSLARLQICLERLYEHYKQNVKILTKYQKKQKKWQGLREFSPYLNKNEEEKFRNLQTN